MRPIHRFPPHDASHRPAMRPGWAVAVASVFWLGVSMGADQPETPQPSAAPERLVLFDGKSLDGWKKTGFVHAGEVKVEAGVLVLEMSNSMTGITSTLRDLPTTDYELSYEAMRLNGSDFFAAATFPVGKSHITLVNGGWGGNVTGLSSLDGADASENETGSSFKYKDKTWYKFRVRVTTKLIRCWIDDKKVVDVEIEGRQIDTRIETHASKPLGFATWETGGGLRGIEIRGLTPSEVAETNKANK
jgi:Domain of Unknown Function (DUF1080)